MKVTVSKALIAYDSLVKLARKELPVRSAFRVGRLILGVEPTVNLANSKREELVRKYGETNGEKITVTKENESKYYEELRPLLEEEIEFDDSLKIMLSDIESVQITPVDMIAIQAFIKEE